MSGPGFVSLMYHELELPGRSLCQTERGYARYVVTESDFRAQLMWLKEQNLIAVSMGEALSRKDRREAQVAVTFDDGCETDLITAAPLLEERGFRATFYIVTGYIGRRGYLSKVQLRELANLNFEVGCHSKSHPFLTDLESTQLLAEIGGAKQELEQLIGRRVDHFSCPGGRWNRRVADVAREAGYLSLATSRIGTNSPRDVFRLARLAVMRSDTLVDFDGICRGRGLLIRQAKEHALSFAKNVLGNTFYDAIRTALLGQG